MGKIRENSDGSERGSIDGSFKRAINIEESALRRKGSLVKHSLLMAVPIGSVIATAAIIKGVEKTNPHFMHQAGPVLITLGSVALGAAAVAWTAVGCAVFDQYSSRKDRRGAMSTKLRQIKTACLMAFVPAAALTPVAFSAAGHGWGKGMAFTAASLLGTAAGAGIVGRLAARNLTQEQRQASF